MKSKKIFLCIAILLLIALLLHASIYINNQISFFDSSVYLYVYFGVGSLLLIGSLVAFICYFSFKKLDISQMYNYGDTESLQIVLNDAVTNGLREISDEEQVTEDCTSDDAVVESDTEPTCSESIVIDFNQLEEDFLTATKMETLYDTAGNWVLNNINVSYVAFSNITGNEKLSIEFYKENVPSEVFLIEAVAERTESVSFKGNITHGNHTLSVPFYQKGVVFGYVFLGFPKKDDAYEPLDTRALAPFIRILSTACLVIELAKTKEQRSSLQKAFSSYVPSAIVDSFEHDPSVLKIGGDYENLTIMFTDLREFTTLSETMSPDNLITVLNEYFSEMSGVIEAFGGTVSKLVGDGILAFFGGPGSIGTNHAEKCCEAALTMKKYEEILNSKLISSGKIKTPLFTRIGISTGKVILGNIGSEKRLDYTVMGPEVNLASRIEAANKNCGTAILISYETFLVVRNNFDCRRAAFMKLKGFSKSVYLFELLDKIKTDTEEKMLLANDLAALLGIDANNLLTGETIEQNNTYEGTLSTATTDSVPSENIDFLEELEDADDLEELD